MPVLGSALSLVRRSVGVLLAAPGAALTAAEGVVHSVHSGPGGLRRFLELLTRAEALLATVEPPLRRGAEQIDGPLIEDLVASARAVPALVGSALVAVGQFEVFVGHAERARQGSDVLLADVTGLVDRIGVVLGDVEEVAVRASVTLDTAGSVVRMADGLAGRAAAVVGAADEIAAAAGDAVAQTADLAQRAEPVLDLTVELCGQLADPVRTVLPVLRSQAPALAALTPDLVTALRELLENLPELLRRLDQEVLPTLQQLRTTPGDVRALRDSVSEIEPKVGEVEAELAGLPGSTLLRRRGRRPDPEPHSDVLERPDSAGTASLHGQQPRTRPAPST